MRKAAGLFLAIFVQAQSASAAQPSQFDLKCAGTGSSYDNGRKFEGPMTRVLHVDLESKQYCVDACETVLRIALVDPVRIRFMALDNNGGALDMFKGNEAVDRRTGAYEMAMLDAANLRHMSMKGTCEPAPFTPFPKTKF